MKERKVYAKLSDEELIDKLENLQIPMGYKTIVMVLFLLLAWQFLPLLFWIVLGLATLSAIVNWKYIGLKRKFLEKEAKRRGII